MAIQVTYNESKTVKTILDDQNPRIHQTEFKCHKCGEWVTEEETLWVNPETGEATTGEKGAPFHEWCAPAEKDTPKCLNCGSSNLGEIDPKDGTQDCLDCGNWNAHPGLNIRFLAQGMIKIPFKDLPDGFYTWETQKQIDWAYGYWSEMDDNELLKGIAYLTPMEDSIIDCLEVDGQFKGEEYPFLAKTITWDRYWDGGRCEDLKAPEEIDKEDRVLTAAPKLLEALRGIDGIAEGAIRKGGPFPALALRQIVDMAVTAINCTREAEEGVQPG